MIKRFRFITLLIVCALFLSGCNTLRERIKKGSKYSKGSTPTQLDKAGTVQEKATDVIDESANKTIARVNEDDTPEDVTNDVTVEQEKILEENNRLKENIQLLRKESEAKENWEKERKNLVTDIEDIKKESAEKIAKLTKERNQYKEQADNIIGKIIMIFVFVGGLLIPLGLVASFKQADPTYLLGSALGVMLIVSAKLINWIQDNWIWIAATMGAAIVAGIWRLYYTNRRTISKQVRITEQLKEEIKALPVQDENEKNDPAKNPKLVLRKMFGDKHTDGEAGRDMDPITKKLIAEERRRLDKEWSATVKD